MIALLISATAIIITVSLYFKQPFQLSLRIAAIVLIYLLATNFSLSIDTTVPQKDPVVLIDHSQSMENHLPLILDKISQIAFPHELLYIQDNQLVKTIPDSLGRYTDLTTAIRKAAEKDPSALILITDGNHNYGTSPLSVADDLHLPIMIYGIGEEKPRDVSISEVVYPAYAYPGDTMKILVTVESSAFQAGSGEVILRLASGKETAAQRFPLSKTPARYTVDLTHVAKDPGKIQFTVDLTPQPDEISYTNNKSSFSVNVLRDRIKVLYYTDHVSFNTRYILHSLRKDQNLSVSAIHSPGPGKYQNLTQTEAGNSPPDRSEYDVVILDNVNLAKLSWLPLPEMMADGQGIILSGVLEGINPAWKSIMPIDVAAGVLKGTYQLTIDEPFSVLTDNEYPPLQYINHIVGAKQDAVVIARTGVLPLIAYRKYDRGRIFQISMIDLGTWHFLQRGLQENDFLYYFLGDMVRFLSPLGEHGRLVMETQHEEYAVGESVDLTLKSYDRNLRPLGGGDFFLVVEQERIPFYETREGYYEASFVAEEKGEFTIFAQGQIGEEQLSSNEVLINVSARHMETEHRLNRALLERIAAATEGDFFSLNESDQLTAPVVHKTKLSRAINFNSPILYMIVLLFFIADWIIRRRRGMT